MRIEGQLRSFPNKQFGDKELCRIAAVAYRKLTLSLVAELESRRGQEGAF